MNCAEVKELLSSYYDGELPSDQQTSVAEHVGECSQCSHERARFEKLSTMVRCLDTPLLPQPAWERLQEQLDGLPTIGAAGTTNHAELRRPLGWIGYRMPHSMHAIAALLLIAVGLIAYSNWFAAGHGNVLAADLGDYADSFQRDPDAAQQVLLAKYDGRPVDLDEAVQLVGYRPAVADDMPPEYAIDSVCLLKMPCCNCLQTICRRSDGSKIAIFEYGEEQPVSFGDRPVESAQCDETTCQLVAVNDQFAANWTQSDRHISVIGIRDQAELNDLVAWLN